MAQLFNAPTPLSQLPQGKTIFLAGSIAKGADDWRLKLASELSNELIVLNPSRPDWDASWREHRDDPQFREQVEWEFAALSQASIIVCHFAPGTQAAVSLLELGLFARSGRLLVVCPEGYWRKGNVDIICERLGVEQVDTLDNVAGAVEQRLKAMESPAP